MAYYLILLVLLLSISLVLISIAIFKLIDFKDVNRQKLLPYECGEQTIGPTWIKIDAGFYLFGLVFLLFDIESIFIIPWTLILKKTGFLGFMEILIFIFILLLGLFYAWSKDMLKWRI